MTIKIQAQTRLSAAPSSMSNNDIVKRLLDNVSRLMDWGMDDMGWSYEKALAHAKEKSTAGPAVWAEIEKKYKHRKGPHHTDKPMNVDNATLQKLQKVYEDLAKNANVLHSIQSKFKGDAHGDIVAALEHIEQAQERIEDIIDLD